MKLKTKQQMDKVKVQKKILQSKKINLKHQQKFLKLPKKHKLNLAMYQLQVANHKKKNKRIK